MQSEIFFFQLTYSSSMHPVCLYPHLNAEKRLPTIDHTVAMAGLPFGTELIINGQVYTVEDLGTPYGHVDIYMNNHQAALQFAVSVTSVKKSAYKRRTGKSTAADRSKAYEDV